MKKYLIVIMGMICSFGHADANIKFETLQSHSQLSKACKQDALDVFKPKTYLLNVGKVTLNSYSCIRQEYDNSQYYSAYAVKFASGKQLFFYDQTADASAYVDINAYAVGSSIVVFDNMNERGGDLILIWLQDAQHVYSTKIPYMTSDEGSVDVVVQGENIILQKKVYIGDDQQSQAKFKKVGQALVLKKENAKGLTYSSGHVKNFQHEAFR